LNQTSDLLTVSGGNAVWLLVIWNFSLRLYQCCNDYRCLVGHHWRLCCFEVWEDKIYAYW